MAGSESNNIMLRKRRTQHVARGVATGTEVFISKAKGAQLWDEDGNEYLDFAGGIGVLNVGHLHPRVVDAIQRQITQFTHVCFQVAGYHSYVAVAERLNALVPGDFDKKTLLVTTGAEAVENAIKIARAHTGRSAVVSFSGAFHGRTLLGLTLTGKANPYRQGFGPFAPEVYHSPYPYEYRGWTADRALEALNDLFLTHVEPSRVAAIIVEPVLGEGGFVPAPVEFLRGLREITRSHGIVFIADEIQTGFGRTASWFAMEHSGVSADITLVAKSLAAGVPLAGVVGRSDIMDAPAPGGLGGTYAGNPLACAAALGVFQAMEEDNLVERASHVGQRLAEGLQRLAAEFSQIGDVRGIGAMQAIELVVDPATREPAASLVDRVVKLAEQAGVILLKAGMYGNVIRFLPPLVVTDQQIDHVLDVLREALKVCLSRESEGFSSAQ